jgi:hypothetical protein
MDKLIALPMAKNYIDVWNSKETRNVRYREH